jgi:hypothetical protein
MGDDTSSHKRELQLAPGILLSSLIELVSPEILSRGWSWVVVVDGATAAVWSADNGVQLLRPDIRIDPQSDPIKVFFRYFRQIDPTWLFRRLSDGASPNRRALEMEYAPLAQEAYERRQRERETNTSKRLLSQPCIQGLKRLGAAIDLHSDVMCRFDAQGREVDSSSQRHGD